MRRVTSYMRRVTCHVFRVTCDVLHVTCAVLCRYLMNLKSGVLDVAACEAALNGTDEQQQQQQQAVANATPSADAQRSSPKPTK